MAVDEDYELLPHEELEELRKEVARIKNNPLGEDKSATDLMTAVQDMTNAMNNLTNLLTQTNDDMLHDFHRSSLQENFSTISSQNEKIAQGILGVAHLLKETLGSQNLTPKTAVEQQQQQQPPPLEQYPAQQPTSAPSQTSITPNPVAAADPFPPPPPPPASSSRPNPMAAFETTQQVAPSMPPPASQPAVNPSPAPSFPSQQPHPAQPAVNPASASSNLPPPLDLTPAPGVNTDPNNPDYAFPPPESQDKKKGLTGMFK